MRRWAVQLALLCCACSSEVVLGIFDPAVQLKDGGATDAGAPDGGSPDAGGADLRLGVNGGWLLEVDGGPAVVDLTLENLGAQPAQAARVSIAVPQELTLVSSSTCVVSGVGLDCDFGALDGGTSVTARALLDAGTVPRWFDFTARATTSSPDENPGDNYVVFTLALTPAGQLAVPITTTRVLSVTYCAGAYTAFAQCPAPSVRTLLMTLSRDGGVDDQFSVHGTWGQSPQQRNVALGFVNGDGSQGYRYVGGSVSASCFEGAYEDGTGMFFTGPWRGCLN